VVVEPFDLAAARLSGQGAREPSLNLSTEAMSDLPSWGGSTSACWRRARLVCDEEQVPATAGSLLVTEFGGRPRRRGRGHGAGWVGSLAGREVSPVALHRALKPSSLPGQWARTGSRPTRRTTLCGVGGQVLQQGDQVGQDPQRFAEHVAFGRTSSATTRASRDSNTAAPRPIRTLQVGLGHPGLAAAVADPRHQPLHCLRERSEFGQ
jgi:hypothetical protein